MVYANIVIQVVEFSHGVRWQEAAEVWLSRGALFRFAVPVRYEKYKVKLGGLYLHVDTGLGALSSEYVCGRG